MLRSIRAADSWTDVVTEVVMLERNSARMSSSSPRSTGASLGFPLYRGEAMEMGGGSSRSFDHRPARPR
eukprot:805849-Pyramimonas_sp.AAC.1